MQGREGPHDQYVTDISVKVSLDLITWTQVEGGRTLPTNIESSQRGKVCVVVFESGPVYARYVRLDLPLIQSIYLN